MKQYFKKSGKLIEAADMFGQGVGIRYNQRQFHKTKLGGLATFLIWTLISYQAYSVIKELVLQENPTVIQQINYVYQPEPFQISPKTFILALGLQDKQYQHFYGEGIYELKAFQNVIKRNKNLTSGVEDKQTSQQFEIKVERCTLDHFQIQESQSYFIGLPYQEMYCLNINQDNPYIEGEFSADKYASIEFQFHKCSGINCKNQTEIDNILTRPTLGVYISDTYVNLKQKTNFFQSTGKNLFWTTGPSMEKDIFLSLINTKIKSDFSIIGSSSDSEQTIQYSSDREITLPSTSDQLFRLTLVYEKNKEQIYHRSYLKAGNAFSQVGGLFNFLLAFGFLFVRRFSQNDLNFRLINEVFDIRDDLNCTLQNEDSDSKSYILTHGKQYSKDKQGTVNNLDDSKTPNFKPNNTNNDDQKTPTKFFGNDSMQYNNEIKKIEVKQFTLNLWQYLCSIWRCCRFCQTTESNLINYATKRIFDHIDLFNIIKKLIEVDKLKQLLLNEDQIKLFEYLPKPILLLSHYNQNKQMNISTDMNTSIFKLPNKAYDKKNHCLDQLKVSYSNITRLKQKSVIDMRIMSMLDPNIKQKLANEDNITPTPPTITLSNLIIKPKSIFNNQFDDEYEDSISRIDELNDIFKPREVKLSKVKSITNIKRKISNNQKREIKISESTHLDNDRQSFQ